MKPLGGIDASFLYMETPQTPMHVAGLSIVELPRGFKGNFYEVYKRHIAERLHLFPVLKKKIVPVPWDIDHPIWVDDDELDIDYHVRHLGLPEPGTIEQLEELVGRLHSNFLDRSRPLWEFYVIDGLADGHHAIYTKIHHAAVDGGAGMALTNMMYDTSPAGRQIEPAPAQSEQPEGQPDPLALLGSAYKNMLSQQVSALQKIPDVLKAIASVVAPVASSIVRLARDRAAEPRRSQDDAQRDDHEPACLHRALAPARRREGDREGDRHQAQRHRHGDLRRRAAPLSAREARLAEGAAGGVRAGVAARRPATPSRTTRCRQCCAAWRPTSRTLSSG